MIWGGNPRSFPPAFSIKGYVIGDHASLFSPYDLFMVLVVGVVMRGSSCCSAHQPRPAHARRRVRAGGRAPRRRARRRMFTVGWALASAVGALAGVLVAPAGFVAPNTFDAVLVFGFTAAVIGGLESPPGAVVGGLRSGLAAQLRRGLLGRELVTLGALVILVAVLMVRPAACSRGPRRGGSGDGAAPPARPDRCCATLRHRSLVAGVGALPADRGAQPLRQPPARDDGRTTSSRSPG